MKYLSLLILLLSFSTFSKEIRIDTVRLTGQIHHNFTKTRVQIKDEFGNFFKIPRSSFPKTFKIKTGKIFSITINKDLLTPDSKYVYITK